ncbi:myb/SANT-like domain, Harbinger transposase-derived nuclease domain protein [Senna tora]|uniref:Myb/SANT-like domain, Harbinger transposase-derived nuclease domain protein n=1 Tax=Senna tora TaxID=362788 RepID=A0A834XB18_9FABA|nr:myb/SANT-like domain, Harbinger transposase-derived nuclease domain protein [Senna tora]
MNRATFDRLCAMLDNIGGLRPTRNMLVDEQVAIFLHILSHHGCLGALDGTHIRIMLPLEDQPRYRNRKGEITTNVLGPNGLNVPEGQYYLVDAGFTNGPGFLAPYRGQQYHLSEWRRYHLINHHHGRRFWVKQHSNHRFEAFSLDSNSG